MALLHPLRIGDVEVPNNLVLSPMAGYTDVAFRALCKAHGAGLVCTEMVAAKALEHDADRARRRMATTPGERPVSIQIVGREVEPVAHSARVLTDHCEVLGLNMGCPAHQVASTGCGAALLDQPDLAVALVEAIRGASPRPLMAKMRTGNKGVMDCAAFARRLEAAGADALIVHGRTAAQSYRGKADWRLIAAVKQAVSIPVIGNGDIRSGPDAERALRESGCDGLAIGRGALGDPRVFARIAAWVERGEVLPEPTAAERLEDFRAYAALAAQGDVDLTHVKVHAQAFTKGIRGGARIREHLPRIRSGAEALAVFEAHVRSAPQAPVPGAPPMDAAAP